MTEKLSEIPACYVWMTEDGEVPLESLTREQMIEIVKQLHDELFALKEAQAEKVIKALRGFG